MDDLISLAVQLRSRPWAMAGSDLLALAASAEAGRLSAARRQATPRQSAANVCIIPIYGYLVQHPSLLTMLGLAVSANSITQRINFAANIDDSIDSILLDINCPGGDTYGMTELSATIRTARQAKPVIAVANSVASGSGYWIASACSNVYITPGGEVGGLGMAVAHEDASVALAKAGIKTTLISAGKYKVEGHPFGPLDAEAKSAMQASVDRAHNMMVGDVARGRGTTVDKVRSDFGGGRNVGAKQAKATRMVDGIATFSDILSDLSGGKTGKRTGSGASSRLLAEIALARAMRR